MIGTKVYVANWAITGLGDKPLGAGDRVVAESDSAEVEQLIACGALSVSDDQSDLYADLSSLSKAELVQHAQEKYGAELDKSETKIALLEAIAEFEAKAEEARLEAAAEAARVAAEQHPEQ